MMISIVVSFRDVVFAPSSSTTAGKRREPGILRILQFYKSIKSYTYNICAKEVELVDEQLEQIEGVVEDIIYENGG